MDAPGSGVVASCFGDDETKCARGLVAKSLGEAAVTFFHLWRYVHIGQRTTALREQLRAALATQLAYQAR